MAARVRQLFGSAYKNGAVVSNAWPPLPMPNCRPWVGVAQSRIPVYPKLAGRQALEDEHCPAFLRNARRGNVDLDCSFQAHKRLGLPLAAKGGPELSGRPCSLAAVFCFKPGLAFIGANRLARLGGFLHESLRFWIGSHHSYRLSASSATSSVPLLGLQLLAFPLPPMSTAQPGLAVMECWYADWERRRD
jgi:hypothetical protein